MTFDEQLQRAFEVMADRLRDDMARNMRATIDELSASADADRCEVARDAREAAEREAAERLGAEVAAAETEAMARGREQGKAEGVAEGRQQGREEGRAELVAAERAASRRLADAVRTISREESLSEVLAALVTCAARETSRAAIFLPSGGRFSGWRLVGFGPSFDAASGIAFADDEAAGVVHEARRTGTAVSSAGTGREAPALAELPPGRESFAVPLSMSGEVVAVLYADQGMSESADMAWPDRIEILARHAEQRLESLTAFRAACLLTEGVEPARVPAPPAVGSADGRGDEAAAAQRYARLLVSEIKLYHEADVIAGRRERDLTLRLGGEIARARALYEQRIPVQVRQATDHFHAELVRTLANGDESLLELTRRI